MAYYPKSQIKTNLYTNGSEYTLTQNSTNGYKGYYFKISSGKLFTGKNPSDIPNYELFLINEFPFSGDGVPVPPPNLITYQYDSDVVYSSTNGNSKSKTREIPSFYLTLPTEQDKQNGSFTRYFCKKNNELKYFEISQTSFTKLKDQDPSMAFDLYSGVSLSWLIKGSPEQVSSINASSVSQVASQNNWLGFSQYFKNYSHYYVGV